MRQTRSKRSAKFASAAALLGLALTASVLVPGSVGAQSDPSCQGLSASRARAAGFVVQIGTEGADTINGSGGVRNFIVGLGGNDTINGTSFGDVICGDGGNDTINSHDGNDRVAGGSGNDVISLGAGNDRAIGDAGDDRLIGGTGNDLLVGRTGADRLSGENGNDILYGNEGNDVAFGGFGNDRVAGFEGDDRLAGGPGSDHLSGHGGNDTISGDDGHDRIFGGDGNDILDGDAGNDLLYGNNGTDKCDRSDGDGAASCELRFGASSAPAPAPAPAPVAVAAPAGSAVPASQAPQGVNRFGWPLLTDAGLAAMLHCESTTNHAINTGNGFYGGVQWLPNTWNAAARLSGFDQYVGVLPHLVPANVQDEVTKDWWAATRPNTQWPTCHKVALEAMNVLAP